MTENDLRQRLAALEAAVDAAEDDVAYSVAVAAVGRFLDETPLEAWERLGEGEEMNNG